MREQVLAVQRMQDYIEEHLESEIPMAQLARQALFSPWHAYRLFREYVGLTPAEYIRRLRLSRAASAPEPMPSQSTTPISWAPSHCAAGFSRTMCWTL